MGARTWLETTPRAIVAAFLFLAVAPGTSLAATPRRAVAPAAAAGPRLAVAPAAAAGPRLAVAPAAAAQAASLPRVRLIATGGTISNRDEGRLTAEELVKSVPGVERYVRPEFEQFANLPSASLSLDQWLELARRINTLFKDDADLSGVVVTSGTDTLEETAYFLHLTVRSDKPVVVVGSMRNPSTPGYEGIANLLDAYRVAADPASRGKGVLVVLNDEINSAREVTKTDARRLETFQTRGYGVLGVVDPDRVAYYRTVVRRHTKESEFDLTSVQALPRVDIALVYQGASGDVIKAMVDQGARGIVVASAGAGAFSGTQEEGVEYAIHKHVVVVTTTRTGSGRIAPSPDAGSFRVEGEDLAPVKARILLMLALTRTKDPAEIQRMFAEY
jgi:L-asparaginase